MPNVHFEIYYKGSVQLQDVGSILSSSLKATPSQPSVPDPPPSTCSSVAVT